MTLAAPLALLALLAVPLVVLLHLAAERWTTREVSSLAFWEEALRGARVTLRLRRLLKTLALLAAILAVAALGIALARPLVAGRGGAGDTVIVVDVSAGMAARAGGTTRLDRAKERARDVVDGLGRGARACVVAAGRSARVVEPFTDDRDALRRAVALLAATDEAGAPREALLFALGLRERDRTPAVVFVTDGAFAAPGDEPLPGGVRWITVGDAADNAGITAFAVRRGIAGGFELFAALAASPGMPRVLPLEVAAGNRTVIRVDVALDTRGRGTVSLPWEGPAEGRVSARIAVADALAADDAAYAVFAPAKPLAVLLVGGPDPFLAAALARFPGVTLRMAAALDPVAGGREVEGWDVVVFDGADVPPLERGNVLAFAAVPPGLPLAPDGAVAAPRFTSWDRANPLLASVEPGSVVVERALRVIPGTGIRVAARSRDAPLVATWEREDLRVLFVAFRPSWSDLPLRAAFPVFVANALAWFRPGLLDAGAASRAPGDTVEVGVPGAGTSVRVTGPDGRDQPWPVSGGLLSYSATSRAGFHRIAGPEGPIDVAVSLCDAGETDLAPRFAAAGGGDGAVPAAPEAPGATYAPEAPEGTAAEGREAQDPAWSAFALAGFILVLAEALAWALARPGARP